MKKLLALMLLAGCTTANLDTPRGYGIVETNDLLRGPVKLFMVAMPNHESRCYRVLGQLHDGRNITLIVDNSDDALLYGEPETLTVAGYKDWRGNISWTLPEEMTK